jgi:protein involved in polysaccharide export with SLBB domain
MSLVVALAKAGGMIPEGSGPNRARRAGAIRIRRASATGESAPLLLPIKGLNIPFADVTLKDGDAIEVESMAANTFTVVGLVNKPGVFPFTPGVKHTLAGALASASGLDLIGNPKYAKVCRQDASGQMLVIPFKINGKSLVDTANIQLKPGDVVAVEQTSRTDMRRILLTVVRVSLGI